jgi:hypothetical protein
MSRPIIMRAGVMAGAAILLMTALTPPVHARVATAEGSAAACSMDVGSVTAAGDHTYRRVTAGTPPTIAAVPQMRVAAGVYAPGPRLSTTFVNQPDIGAVFYIAGWVVQGSALYRSTYSLYGGSLGDPPGLARIGGGWADFKLVEESEYIAVEHGPTLREPAYALRNDGTLFRWWVDSRGWHSAGNAGGFAAVKTMALISKTRTYDTFLATTRGGGLYTVRIPTTSPMKPVVKLVRARTWQVFEKLMAVKCGVYGTLLLGVDKDTKAGYLYAVGHANGTATVIKGLGKVQGTFSDPVDFRWRNTFDPLNGD